MITYDIFIGDLNAGIGKNSEKVLWHKMFKKFNQGTNMFQKPLQTHIY